MSNTQPKNTDSQQIQLGPNGLQGFDYVSTRHDALIPIGVPVSALLEPAFWAHHGVKLKPMDEIRARAEDGTWMANFLVLDCSRTWAKVKQLDYHSLTSGDVAVTQASEAEVKAVMDAHQVVHRGPHKWSVVRKSDKAVLEENLGEKEKATAWLEDHARAMVGAPKPAARPENVAA